MDDLVQVTEKVQVITKCTHGFGDERSHPHGYAEASLRLSSLHCLPVYACQRDTLPCQFPAQAGYVVTQSFDAFHLLIQVVSPSEVTQMGSFLSVATLYKSSSD